MRGSKGIHNLGEIVELDDQIGTWRGKLANKFGVWGRERVHL